MTTELPRAMLIDMDDTILSAYGRPEIAWNNVAAEFAGEFAPLLPQQVAATIVDAGRILHILQLKIVVWCTVSGE